ncbi:hypothetical protein JTB14_030163 [Gonioctena quinquepunctata]|nr:hypothetical protein JTB14_030163 [Gonioctena quinquepunctata]
MCTYCNGFFCTNARATPNAGSDSEDDSLQTALSQRETEGAAEQSYSSLIDGCDWTAQDTTENVEANLHNSPENAENGSRSLSIKEDDFQPEPSTKRRKKH